jgi:hypothetical protein
MAIKISGDIVIDNSKNATFNTLNVAGVDLYTTAQAAYDRANTASANTIYTQGVDVTQNSNITAVNQFAQGAYNTANGANGLAAGAYDTANGANGLAQGAYNTANTNSTNISIIQGVDVTQNTRLNSIETVNNDQNTSISIIQGVNTWQNSQITAVNQFSQSAFDTANGANGLAAGAYNSANTNATNITAVNQFAQSAYDKANTAITTSGGSISGSLSVSQDLTVSGNLTVLGNTTQITVNTLEVKDTIITLGTGNYTSDALDIGFAGHYNDGTNAHAGLIRDSGTKEFYVFQGYTPDTTANNININDSSFQKANLNADYFKGNLITHGVEIYTYNQGINETQNTNITAVNNFTQSAYGTANNASSNTIVTQGVDLWQNSQITAVNQFAAGAYNAANTNATNITIIQGVNNTQNTNITNADSKAQAAYDNSNTKFSSSGGTISGNVTANYYFGDGSKLTGLAPAQQIYTLNNVVSGVSDYMVLKSLATYTVGTQNTTTRTVTTTPTLLTSFITDAGFPNITSIPTGDLIIEFDTQKASGVGGYYCYAEIYKRTSGGVETLLTRTENTSSSTLNSQIQQRANKYIATPLVLDVTDRIVVKIYAVMLTTSASISILFDGAADGALTLPVLPATIYTYVPYVNATANVSLGSYSLSANTVTANVVRFSDGTSQTSAPTNIDSFARTTANTATNNITILQGVDIAQNAAISIIQGVDLWQNTQITYVNQFAQAAFDQANTGQIANVQLTHSNTVNGIPTSLLPGEPSINLNDGRMFIQLNNGKIIDISSTPVGKTYYVSSNGNDNYDGTTPGAAKATIKAAVALASPGDSVVVSSGTYTENTPIIIPQNVQVQGSGERTCIIQPQTSANDVFWVNNNSYVTGFKFTNYTGSAVAFPASVIETGVAQSGGTNTITLNSGASAYGNYYSSMVVTITGGTGSGQSANVNSYDGTTKVATVDANWVTQPDNTSQYSLNIPLRTTPASSTKRYTTYITGSPYIYNSSSITSTGTGIKVDGDLATGGKSMISAQFTQVNSGGKGVHILNDGYAQLVSIYGIFCDTAFLAESGGTASMGNCNVNFGNRGLVANGKGKLAMSATLANNSSSQTYSLTLNNVSANGSLGVTATIPYSGLIMKITGDGDNYYSVSEATTLSGGNTTVTFATSIANSFISGTSVEFYQQSQLRASGQTFEFVGSGTSFAALPKAGGVANSQAQIITIGEGAVFATATDQSGNFIVSDLTIDQETSTISGRTFTKSLFAEMTPYILALEG